MKRYSRKTSATIKMISPAITHGTKEQKKNILSRSQVIKRAVSIRNFLPPERRPPAAFSPMADVRLMFAPPIPAAEVFDPEGRFEPCSDVLASSSANARRRNAPPSGSGRRRSRCDP
jgi:hypothetical protein